MAEFDDDIDKVFHRRLGDVKDHSVDPASQWGAVSDMMGAAGRGVTATGSGFSYASVAAAVATLAVIVGVATKDTATVSDVGLVGTIVKPVHQDESVGANDVKAKSQQTHVVQAEVFVPKTSRTEVVSPQVSNEWPNQQGPLSIAAASPNVRVEEGQSARLGEKQEELALMERLEWGLESAPDIEERSMPSGMSMPALASVSAHDFYVRGGIRSGRGESNTLHNPGSWRVNNVLGLGYAIHFTPRTFLSAEANYLHRTGNGIERSKEVDFTPLVGVIASAYNQIDEQKLRDELKHIRESLVAVSMDYLQMPIQLHVEWSKKANASVGVYAEYLLRVRNESYMVYNSQDYIPANVGSNDLRSKDGLKRMRYGVMAGFERQINSHWSADVRGMLPVTSIYDRESQYSVYAEPSQLIDFQVALSYRI
jgi:hypothetical protein